MLSYIGAGLLAGGFTAFGVSMASRLKRRLSLITALVGALDYMETEISYGLTPLPELLQELARRDRVLGEFWRAVSYAWTPGERFRDVWIVQVKKLDLKEPDLLLVEEIGRILGSYDAERQAGRLAFIKKKLEQSQRGAREEFSKNGRLFCALGVVFGLTLAIVLI